jgi:uncharacterized membrane protein YdjX (TVP38/TMEM64 family)
MTTKQVDPPDRPAKPMQTGALRRWLPLGVIIAVMVLVVATGGHKALTFENLALKRDALRVFVASNTALALLGFMAVYIAAVALSLPGGLVLTISGGLLFGVWLAVPATVVAATIGATIIFLIARSSLGSALASRAGPWLDRFRQGFEREGVSYMLFLRLVPFPFFIINIAPAILGVPLRTFVIGTFFGIMPATVAFSYLGDTLDRVLVEAKAAYDACAAVKGAGACSLSISLEQLPIAQILLALTLIGLVALIPPILNRWRARHAAV